MSDSVWPYRQMPTRLPHPWDSPGKNTGVGCHFLLQCMKGKGKGKSLSRVRLLATPWTAAYQAPPSMGFSRQEYWSRVPLPSPKLIFSACANKTWLHYLNWSLHSPYLNPFFFYNLFPIPYFANQVHIVKAMVFPVVMYRCESWTIKKAEHWRIDAFKLWC